MRIPICIFCLGFAAWVAAQPPSLPVVTNKVTPPKPLAVPVQPQFALHTNVIFVDLTSIPSNGLFRSYTVLRSSNALTDFNYVTTFSGQTNTITDVTTQSNAYYQVVGSVAITTRATNK